MVTDVVPQRIDQCESNETSGSGEAEEGSVCELENTLQYSLNQGLVITNILTSLYPGVTFIQPLVAFSLVIAFITLGSGYLGTDSRKTFYWEFIDRTGVLSVTM